VSTFSSDIGPEEEDGAGWSGLAPTRAELRAEARQFAEQRDAKRWRFLAEHWHSLMMGVPLHKWIADNALRLGGVGAALDYATPLYDQASLDAAVVAERERWAPLVRRMRDSFVDVDFTHWPEMLADQEECLAECERLLGPNVGVEPHSAAGKDCE
jgi:hypothetical protein